MLNIENLIKKWNNFSNWFLIAPIFFCLGLITFCFILAFSFFLGNLLLLLTSSVIFVPSIFIALIIFSFYNLIYVIKSDGIFKNLNLNRTKWNIINIISTLMGLNFIVLIIMYIKVQDVYENNNIESNIFLKVKL